MKKFLLCLLTVWVLAACAPAAPLFPTSTPRTVMPVTLTPYAGLPPTATPSPTAGDTPTPLPTATPTPRLHTIRRGEDLFGIALFYGVTLQDLLTANPTVNPYALRVGDQVVVPAAQTTPTLDPRNPPSPTPVGLTLPRPDCYPTHDGGMWCFALLNNPQSFDVEGVSVVFHLYDRSSGEILSQAAYPPLNRLPAAGQLPLAVFFAPPAPRDFDVSVELRTALPIPAESRRYLDMEITRQEVVISEDGSYAEVSGSLRLKEEESAVARPLLAAVALDESGKVVGLRRWQADQPLAAGESLPFEVRVYSTGLPIAEVRLLAEGVP